MRRLFNALALGLVIGLAGVLAVAIAPFANIEESVGLHWMFNLRGPVSAPAEVVVVAIDEQSAQKLGLPDKPRDWPRNLHAQLVHYLAQAGARVICFDLTFDVPSTPPSHDQEFSAAIERAGNVLLAASLRKETIRMRSATGQSIGNVVIEKPAPPIPILEKAARGHAPFLLPKSSRVNTYWTFRSNSGDAPTLPVLAFQIYARDAFEGFLTLLRKVEPDIPLGFPEKASQVLASEAGASITFAVRDALIKDPRIGERMSQQLRDSSGSDLTVEGRRAIQSLLHLYSTSETSYLNFYGPPRSIETVSYYRVLEAARSTDPSSAGGLDANAFRNKAVFVGFSAASEAGQDRLRDDYRTVYSQPNGLDISGVEVAATAFANLLEDRPLRPTPPAWQLAIVAAWGLALGIACRLLRPIPAAGVVYALAAVYLWVVYDRFVDAALWLPSIIPIGVQLPLALFAGLWLNYLDTRREREIVKQAIGRYLPSAVVDQLARNIGPITSANQVVFGTCLATDAEKYTSLAENMDPGELGKLMNEYYAELFVPVERLGGVVVDVVGDAMVAIWAAASSDAKLRGNACQAALEIIQALDRFNGASVGRPALLTRFGLHSGQMLVGSIGASRHYEYRAVGDIVNTASRIQSLNKTLGTRLLASEPTVDDCLDQFITRPLGSFLLAGKSNAVSVVELLGRKQDLGAQSSLCEMFAGALDAYRSRRWREAADRFSDILQSVPDDGPSRFYRERCEHMLLNPPDGEWTPTIRVDIK